jgi:DNA-binding CsgD family transcriptional regulator
MDPEYEMLFETTMRSFLGEKAYQIAGQVYNEKYRKEWYRKALRKIIKRVQEIDTSTKHKESIAYCSERALKVLSQKHFNETKLSLYLLCLIGSLLGFLGMGRTPVYLKTFYTEAMSQGTDVIQLMQNYNKNSISIRKRIINQLRKEGLNDFQISLVLNTSEYQVKKLRREL